MVGPFDDGSVSIFTRPRDPRDGVREVPVVLSGVVRNSRPLGGRRPAEGSDGRLAELDTGAHHQPVSQVPGWV
jgi:hypothetical protein